MKHATENQALLLCKGLNSRLNLSLKYCLWHSGNKISIEGELNGFDDIEQIAECIDDIGLITQIEVYISKKINIKIKFP